MDYKLRLAYGRKDPVITAQGWVKTEPPEQLVATFY